MKVKKEEVNLFDRALVYDANYNSYLVGEVTMISLRGINVLFSCERDIPTRFYKWVNVSQVNKPFGKE